MRDRPIGYDYITEDYGGGLSRVNLHYRRVIQGMQQKYNELDNLFRSLLRESQGLKIYLGNLEI